MSPPTRTPLMALADLLLGQPVQDWVRGRRDEKVSFRRIALELHEKTGGQISVTDNTIRAWAAEQPSAAAS